MRTTLSAVLFEKPIEEINVLHWTGISVCRVIEVHKFFNARFHTVSAKHITPSVNLKHGLPMRLRQRNEPSVSDKITLKILLIQSIHCAFQSSTLCVFPKLKIQFNWLLIQEATLWYSNTRYLSEHLNIIYFKSITAR